MNKISDFLNLKFMGIPMWIYIGVMILVAIILKFCGSFNRTIFNWGSYEENTYNINSFNGNKNSPRKELFDKKMKGLDLPSMLDVVWAQDFAEATDVAYEAVNAQEYERAQCFAQKSRMLGIQLIEDSEDLSMPFSPALKDYLSKSAHVVADTSLSIENYHDITGYCALVKRVGAYNPTNEAYCKYAETRLSRKDLVVPEKDEMDEMKELHGEDYCREFLKVLMECGYLQPMSIAFGVNGFLPISYSGVMGFNGEPEYRKIYQVRTYDNEGNETRSNKISSRYCGSGRSEMYDFSKAISGMCGTVENKTKLPQIWFDKRKRIFRDKDMSESVDRVAAKIFVVADREFSCDDSLRSIALFETPVNRDDVLMCSVTKTVPVPEPNSGFLILVGMAGLALRRKQA